MGTIPNRAIQHRSRPTPTGDTYTYNRTPTEASLRVDLTRFRDPDEAADRLLLACDELAALLTNHGQE